VESAGIRTARTARSEEPSVDPTSPPTSPASETAAEESARVAKKGVPEGLWLRCPGCGETIFRKAFEADHKVCPKCRHHGRLTARERVAQLIDPGTFEPLHADIAPADPLQFVDLVPYRERVAASQRKTGENDGVQTGTGFVKGRKVVLAALDFSFMGGSMGSVIGEKTTLAIELATNRDWPLVIVSCSGGARMQESGFSLMQMAKTSSALARLDEAGGLFVSVLADPTTGGVTASFAMLGDVILAEPRALIGFAGPRVIAQTIRQELPPNFQTAEFLLESGFVDRIVDRADLRSEISRLIDYAGK